jgi:hypothetical protein
MTQLINRTPHLLRIYRTDGPDTVTDLEDGLELVLPPVAPAIRLATIELGTQGFRGGVAIEWVEFGHAHDLPTKQDGISLVVALAVALACHGRDDLLFPYREVRNEQGTVVGCRQLGQVC